VTARLDIGLVIDPGHGGRDSGACGHGLRECDINLAVAQHFADAVLPHVRYVLPTRTRDEDVTLAQRVNLANGHGPETRKLFVSVHCNATPVLSPWKGKARGSQAMYYRNDTEGAHLAGVLLDALRREVRVMPWGGSLPRQPGLFQRSDLYVLRRTNCAAALVEIGFIDHPADAAQMRDEAWQQAVGIALAKGVVRHCYAEGVRLAEVA